MHHSPDVPVESELEPRLFAAIVTVASYPGASEAIVSDTKQMNPRKLLVSTNRLLVYTALNYIDL